MFVYGLHVARFQTVIKIKKPIGKYTQCSQLRQDYSLINEASAHLGGYDVEEETENSADEAAEQAQ